eukprot:scaffold16706_cov153-Amphora_coffeaeformis.AAC.4
MKLHRTRTHLELRVGDAAVVDVVLYLRQADLEWFNTDPRESSCAEEDDDEEEEDTAVLDHGTDLFQVLEQSVLPRMLHTEVEQSHYKQYPASKPPPLGPHGIPILAGDDSKKQPVNIGKKGTKRKRPTAKEKAAAARAEEEDEKAKSEKDVYYAFGKTLQLAYRCEPIPDSNA